MKTTTKILSMFIAIVLFIIFTTNTNTYAMGNGNGQGKGQGQGQGNGMGQNYGGKQGSSIKTHSPVDMLKDIAISDLSLQETQDLYYQYSEEMLARDLYNHFYGIYGTQTFLNIANSEQQHMDAVKSLLDRYSLEYPSSYGELQSNYDSLKAEGEKGLKEALEVGVKIEILDINDIVDTIKSTDNDDLKVVFTNIGGASYNHMRGFLKALKSNNFTTEIDYSKYLNLQQVDSTGTLKYLLSEKLTAEGITLPDQVSSANIKANCANEVSNTKAREGYKSQIDKKYGKGLKKYDNSKLQTIDLKIDAEIEKIETTNTITGSVKQETLNLYYALKDYIGLLFR
ncbi:MAG: DUF2202 domain-containing protein [Candidatus Gracilibacteria bacterium]|nr:DUF2202 domain-containing protein [Candidatus Gracilibacteria bacterium]